MLEPRVGAAHRGDYRRGAGAHHHPRRRLREFDNGPLAGLAFDEAERRYPEPAFWHRFAPYTADGGEAYAETAQRIGGALQTLVQGAESRVLVVAHGGCINVALRDLLGAPVATSFALGDTSFSEVWVSRASDRVRLLSLDRAPHLLVGA